MASDAVAYDVLEQQVPEGPAAKMHVLPPIPYAADGNVSSANEAALLSKRSAAWVGPLHKWGAHMREAHNLWCQTPDEMKFRGKTLSQLPIVEAQATYQHELTRSNDGAGANEGIYGDLDMEDDALDTDEIPGPLYEIATPVTMMYGQDREY